MKTLKNQKTCNLWLFMVFGLLWALILWRNQQRAFQSIIRIQKIIISKDGNRPDLHSQISSNRKVIQSPLQQLYLHLIFAILQFERTSLMNLIFSLLPTWTLQATVGRKIQCGQTGGQLVRIDVNKKSDHKPKTIAAWKDNP